MKKIILFCTLFIACVMQGQNNAIFKGGNGSGWAVAVFSQPGNDIYKGGGGDGWTMATSSVFVLSVLENEIQNLAAYPNPTSGDINIDLGQTYSKLTVRVIDELGKIVSENRFIDTNSLHLNINGHSGVYFLRVDADGRSAVIKAIKN